MTIAATKLSAEQFLMLGEDPPGVRLELVDGVIAVSPSPSVEHSHVDRQLSYHLVGHIREHDLGMLLGDVDTIFDQLNVRRPDILFLAKDRLHLLEGHGIPIAPDMCVEILSPSSMEMDQEEKFRLYAKHGVANYWIIDPMARWIKAYQLKRGKYALIGSGKRQEVVCFPPFGDLRIPLGDLWMTRKK